MQERRSIKTLDNVVFVNNPKTPRSSSGNGVNIVFKEDLSIGVKAGDEKYMFGNRLYFNTDMEGSFFVTDWDRKRIQKYDASGQYVLTIGRQGQGPGEFQNVWRPQFDKDGNLYVTDISNRKIVFFDKDGRLLREQKIPGVSSDILINNHGYYVTTQSTFPEDQAEKPVSTFGVFDAQFQLISEIHRETRDLIAPSGGGEDAVARSLAGIISQDAFKPVVSYQLAPDDTLYFGYPQDYAVELYTPEGKLKHIIKREYEPKGISEEDKKAFLEEMEAEFFRFLPPRAAAVKDKAIRLIEYPKCKPAYKRITLMENGWLAVIVDSFGSESTVLDIFDRQGRYIAQLETSLSSEGLFFKNGQAYALVTDPDGFKFLKRYSYDIREN